MNGINLPIKKQGSYYWIRKRKTKEAKIPFQNNAIESKGWKKIQCANSNHTEAAVAILSR